MAPESITNEQRAALAALGRMGGKARLTKMTPEARHLVAKRAAQARWGKKADAPQPPDPNGPSSPDRDRQGAEAGIMLTGRRPSVSASRAHRSGRNLAAAA